ncbi:ABC transporter substrate-binding protein [Desulfosporosinus sp. PR]|uniref:ABC transporter substrate-binding protein n=1 Tax=Candidatus Desulfosporosinus nitrosoreducens TaxID=3401928 RepID=UPI0027FCE8EE|nr:ABC transporter substrate-binding protein [Desulfosporosinus sp. PR]MDQ7095669.1 ABC transporter substrate-binding protein [Desulfosporosinus sp. PR]
MTVVMSLRILCGGVAGADVVKLQSTLAALGYNPGVIDGIFGGRTAAAVVQFQKDNGLLPDEIVGPITWKYLQRIRLPKKDSEIKWKFTTTGSQRTIKDRAGRIVSVPRVIKRAFATSPMGSIILYSLCPYKMVGWNNVPRFTENRYILPQCQSLPGLGGWYGRNTGNTEGILQLHPDVLIGMGDVTPAKISKADRIQQQLGIPVVLIDAPMAKMDEACEFMGALLGERTRAHELAEYCRNTIVDVSARAARIPKEKRVKVYYAEGVKGLHTEPEGSRHIEVLSLVGGDNVAKLPLNEGVGMSPVSLRELLLWNPEVILAWGEGQGGYYQGILTDPSWRGLRAVQQNRVYQIPSAPFNWLDRPPSINRILGVKWLGNLLYPDVFNYNMVEEVREFFIKFYHCNLSGAEARVLLAQKKF